MNLLRLFAVAFCVVSAIAVDPDCLIQTYWPDLYDCSKYYECNSSSDKQEMTCPDGTLWNDPLKTCDYPYNVDCSWTVTASTATPTPSASTTSTPSSGTTVDPSLVCDVDHTFYPDYTDCQGFYECINGIKVHELCPEPLLWNVSIPGCAVVSDCSQLITTTNTPTATTPDPSTTCTTENQFFPDPYDCHNYYQCHNGIKQHLTCPDPLLWNVAIQGCTITSDCSQVLSTSSVAPTTPDPSNTCTIENEYFPDIYDCHSYYECHSGIKQHMICPDPLYWNIHIQGCTPTSDCSQVISTSYSPTSSTASPTTPDPSLVCSVEMEFFPDPLDCSAFYECRNGYKQHMYCPDPLLWNVYLPGCTQDSDCSQTSGTTTTESPTDPDCMGSTIYWPDYYDCSKYYECNAAHQKVPKTCPDGTLWNNNILTCDYAQNVDCSWTINPTGSTPTAPTASTIDPNLVCSVEMEFFPDPLDCTGFYECRSGIKQHFYCPDPLLWNVYLPGCTQESDCSQLGTTTRIPTSTTVTCTNGDYTGDTRNCHRFYTCENQKWVGPLECPADLYWSESQKACVDLADSDCSK